MKNTCKRKKTKRNVKSVNANLEVEKIVWTEKMFQKADVEEITKQ